MTEKPNREIVEEYCRCLKNHDPERLGNLLDDEFKQELPQSGERICGRENLLAIAENYPGGTPSIHTMRITGSQDRWVLTPSWTVLRVTGSGDNYTCEGQITYPDGSVWHLVEVLELRDGRILRSTPYLALPSRRPGGDPNGWNASKARESCVEPVWSGRRT